MMKVDLLRHRVVYINPNKQISRKDELLVGLGNMALQNEGVVLQHKTAAKKYDSLSAYVFGTSFVKINTAGCCTKIYIEDFSVDTVIALWIFLTKVLHHELPDNITTWINYANQWEQGNTSSTGKPFTSYGCLQNALAHSMGKKSPKEIMLASFIFLEYLVNNEIAPASIPALDLDEYAMANKTLEEIYKKYRILVNKSEVEKLCIPSPEEENCVEVSAVFIEEPIVSSIIKVFLRHDEKSPTKDGYALMAVYNEKAKGTGNDIVISVDPSKHIYLKSLWNALEKEENRLWNGKRPKDMPRPLISYPDNNGPNEPWWDDMGKYTLIAAPKMVGGEYGRRVSWKRVKELVKELYVKGM